MFVFFGCVVGLCSCGSFCCCLLGWVCLFCVVVVALFVCGCCLLFVVFAWVDFCLWLVFGGGVFGFVFFCLFFLWLLWFGCFFGFFCGLFCFFVWVMFVFGLVGVVLFFVCCLCVGVVVFVFVCGFLCCDVWDVVLVFVLFRGALVVCWFVWF